MKRVMFWLLAISFTFVLGVAATLVSLEFFSPAKSLPEISAPEIEDESAEMPFLSYCELVKNPEKYHDRIVRFTARMLIGLENSSFSDDRCGVDSVAVATSRNKEVWNAIEKARAGKNKNERWAFVLDLTVTGRFKNIPATECCTKAPFQFEIISVERASKAN